MNYISTRNKNIKVSAAQAISQGISKDGGLFVPETIPALTEADFNKLKSMSYVERAAFVLKLFLTDFTDEEIDYCVKGAYLGSFDNDNPAPLKNIGGNTNILELWHGPTCAFKDLALQLLPYLLTTSAKKVSGGKEIVILVATSGDTGKAALEGFCDVENTKIIVFYPNDGVSAMQKLQMDTQKGDNVFVCAINGNFDDAQTGVKKIFTDNSVAEILEKANMQFSSANSINWGRLAPQIIYYISAYCDMLKEGTDLSNGFNVVVPTGNFGNILAAYYAKVMGVPINKLICASNANNVLTDFINTGIYDRNRKFYTTISPSMDILISSNLERMLFEICGRDDKTVAALQADLNSNGKYTVSDEIANKFKDLFFGGCCDDEKTLSTIKDTFNNKDYLCDTHTAVAVNVYNNYVETTGDNRPAVIASTASPYKFANSVLEGIGEEICSDEFSTVEKLSSISGVPVPAPIDALKNASPRFNNVCEKQDMIKVVLKNLGL
ncbi:MAG: threonine synthase [Clostridia bacterium]|nr:threonine synthase [Clostridia bacterium]